MACKINSIEQRYRETNPTLADKLTDIAMNAWQSIKDSGVFQKEGLSYVFNAPNTKKRIEQDKVVDTINATQPTPFVKEKEGKVSVNALLLEQPSAKKSGIDEIFESNPELSNIGTPEQYSEYLDTIFPDSKVKDIVYRGEEKEDNALFQYFTKNKAEAYMYAKANITKGGNITERNPLESINKVALDYFDNKYGENTYSTISLNENSSQPEDWMIDFDRNGDAFVKDEYLEVLDKIKENYRNKPNVLKKLSEKDRELTENIRIVLDLYDDVKIESESDLMKQFDDTNYINNIDAYKAARKFVDDNLDFKKIRENIGQIITAIINIKNPYTEEIVQEDLKNNRDAYKNGKDGALLMDGDHFLVKSNTEQIHILGSKQDIEGFRNYVNNTFNSRPGVSEVFESNPELANSVYEALGFKNEDSISKDLRFEYVDSTTTHDYFKVFYKEQDLTVDSKISDVTVGITLSIHNQGYIDAIEIPKGLRNKGLGKSIYRKVNSELLQGNLKSDSLGRISEDAKRVWESLVKSGEAVKTSDGYSFTQSQISPQQKQQAQQLYSQYLDTIFPKNTIVYRGSEKGRTDFQTRGFFTDKLSYAKEYAFDKGFVSKSGKEIVNTFLINTSNVKNVGEMNTEYVKNELQDLVLKGVDKGRTKESGNVYATTSKNLHELGSKQDIEGFKNFISGNKTDAKFLPFQASLAIQEKYGKEVTQEQLQTDPDIIFHQSFINKEGIPVGIYTYKDETNPKFNILGDSIDEALSKLKRDGINNNRLDEPELREGQFRLYRAEDHTGNSSIPDWLKTQPEYDGINDAAGRWFYRTKEEAEYHARTFGGKLMYVDIPTNTVEQYNARDNKFVGGYGKAGKEYFVTKEIGERRKPLPTLDENTVAPIENEPIPNQPRLAHNIEQMLDDLATRFQVNWGYDYEMAQRGAIRDGKVLINPNHATFDTPFHEYLHPFINLIKQQGSPFYQLLSNSVMSVTDITGKSVLFETKKNNPNLVGDELIEEAIVEAAGLAAIGRLVETSANKSFLDYLRMFLDNIGKLLGFDFEQNVDLNTPFRTVVNMMLDSNFVYDMRPYANNANQRLTRDEIRNVLNQLNEDIVTEYESSVNEQGIDEQIRKQRNIRTGDIYTGVHEDIVQPHYDKIFKNKLEETPGITFQKDAGTALHEVFQNTLFEIYIDPSTNKLRPDVLDYYLRPTKENLKKYVDFFTPIVQRQRETVYAASTPDVEMIPGIDSHYFYEQIHGYLDNVVRRAVNEHGSEVKFYPEQRLLNTEKGRAGTADLLIVGPTHFDIYDWKTISPFKYNAFNGTFSEIEMLAAFKETAYKLQMKEYATMAHQLTGLRLNNARAIPIAVDISKNQNKEYELGHILFGDPTFRSITTAENGDERRYLLPVTLEGETPENKLINDFIRKLEGYIKVYSDMLRADKDQRKIGRELQIDALRKIIQDLQISQNHKNILNRVDVLNKLAEEQIMLSDDTINIEKLTDIKYELDLYKDMQKYFDIEGKPGISYDMAQKQQLVIYMIDRIVDRTNNYTANAALNKGVPNILENEMAYTGAKRWFTETSAITKVRTVAFFDKLKRKAQGIAHQGKIKYYEKLSAAMEGLKNEDIKKFFHTVNGKMQPRLISKYNLKEKLEEIDNNGGYDETMFISKDEAYLQGLENYTAMLKDSLHFKEHITEKGNMTQKEFDYENLQIDAYNDQQNEYFLRKEQEWISKNSLPIIMKDQKASGINWKYFDINPAFEDQWLTPEYKELAKNPKRLELYNVIQDINDDAYKLGLITYRNKFTHFPAILANSQEKVLAGETGVFSMQRFLDDLKASDQDEETITGGKVEINPITKKIIRTIPKLYQNRLGVKNADGTYDYSKQSFNLAKVFGQYVNHIKEYEARQDLELQASLLMDLEARKSNVVVNGNKAIYQEDNEGNLIKEVTEGVNKNTGILEKAINRSVYGVTPFSDVKSTVKIFGKEINGVRVLRKLMAWRSMTSLGLNASSAAVTGMGGGLNMILEANRNGIYSKKDIANAITTLTQTTFRETKAMRVLKMLQSIDPIMDDLNEHRINQLSLTKFDQIVTSDNLFFMMRNVDKATQFVSGMAVMNNYMVKDGQLIEISKYVRNLNNFDAEFNRLTQAKEWNQLKQLENKVKADIEELKSKESVVSKEMAGEDSGITEEMQRELRPILQKYSKQILGNMSRDDVAQYKDTILGQLAGQFRGWMPRLAMQRFGGAEMDGVTGKLNWGKYLTLVNIFSKDILSLIKSTTGTLNDSSYDKILAKYNDLLQTHIDNGGTKDDFISLSEFKELYVNNLRSALKEVLMMISMTILAYSLTMAWDDDDKLNAAQKYTLLLLNRANNELTFYINPKSATELLKSPFPVISTLTDLQSFASHLNKETFNQIQQLATGDEEEDLKKAKPSKYLFKLFPVTKEMMNWGALLDDDFRKEFNINLGVR